ncbi:MAG: alkaline phosphatase family protein [Pseudonocardia sp.]
MLVSPYARRGFVDHETHDFTSILRLIQVNWGLAPLADRDAAAGPMLEAFDFTAGPRPAVLLSTERHPVLADRPRTWVVYAGYALVCAFVAGLLAAPRALSTVRRHRARPHPAVSA